RHSPLAWHPSGCRRAPWSSSARPTGPSPAPAAPPRAQSWAAAPPPRPAPVGALERRVVGDRQPHPSAQWLKTLRVDDFRVWWAYTDMFEEYEDGVLGAFGETVPSDERTALFDQSV